jgi:exodeoxyribonuclease VII small subunit
MSKKKESAFNFEESLRSLENLVSAMEEGNLSLEESLQAFEKGIRLTRECQAALLNAEQKVQILIDENASPEALSFEADEADKYPASHDLE